MPINTALDDTILALITGSARRRVGAATQLEIDITSPDGGADGFGHQFRGPMREPCNRRSQVNPAHPRSIVSRATDPDRKFPYRDEQRAFYDSLRDILAARNGVRLIRLRYGTFDWTGPGGDEQLNNLLAKCRANASQPVVLPTAQAMSRSTVDQVRKVALISHNYCVHNSHGLQDYSEHFARINKLCDDQGCDTILYALWTWDQDSTVTRTTASIFGGLHHVQRVILELWHKPEKPDHAEIWQRGNQEPKLAFQRFARSGDSDQRKARFINELPDRLIVQALLVLCGESGIVKEKEAGVFTDKFGFLDRFARGGGLLPAHAPGGVSGGGPDADGSLHGC
jgi:hypothetical protein